MSSPTTSPARAAAVRGPQHSLGQALLWSVVTVAAAPLGAYFALAGVDGVTHTAGSSSETEFVNGGIWMAAFLLVVPVYLAARASFFVAPAVVLAASWPQFHVARAVIERYHESGWGTGLESLNEVQAGFMAAAFVLAALLGAGRRWVLPTPGRSPV